MNESNQPYRRFGAFSSSVDPNKLAKTVEGVLKAIAGLVAYMGVSAVAGDINSLGEQLSQGITLGYALWGVAETAFGIVRKVAVALHEKLG
jgi:hypothetical protein